MSFSMRLLLFFFLVMAAASCQLADGEGRRDVRDYYFPLKKLTEGLVYEFRPVNGDSLAPVYWYYRSFVFPDSVFLTATYYEDELLPLQFVREQMVDNGMITREVFLYENDSTGAQTRIPVTIEQGSAFPFSVRDSGGVFLYNVHWSSPNDPEATYTVVKNRRYVGDTSFVFQGKTYDGIVFQVRELIEEDREGVFEQEFNGREVYAKGLGLVYYRKDISEGLRLEYRLADRYPMTDLEEQFRRRYYPDRPMPLPAPKQ